MRTPGCFLPDTVDRMRNYGEYADEWVVRATARMLKRDITVVTSSVYEGCTTRVLGCPPNTTGKEPLLIGQLMDGAHFLSLGLCI